MKKRERERSDDTRGCEASNSAVIENNKKRIFFYHKEMETERLVRRRS